MSFSTSAHTLPVHPDHDFYTPFALGNSSNGLYISSASGSVFHVHAVIMQMASGVFRDMINGAVNTGEIIALHEGTDVLKTLLDIVHAGGTTFDFKGRDMSFVWALLRAADKYDVHKLTSEIRACLTINPFFQSHPLESHAMACQYGWKQEIRHTLSGALACLNEPASARFLEQLDAIHIMRLHWLLEKRKTFVKTELKKSIDKNIIIGRYNLVTATVWSTSSRADYQAFEELFFALVEQEIDKYPSGGTLYRDFWRRNGVKFLFLEDKIEILRDSLAESMRHFPCEVDSASFE